MTSRAGRVAVAIICLLVVLGCVVLLVLLLQVKGLQYAASVAGVLGVALTLLALAIPLVRRLRPEPAPTADQVGQARETLAGLVAEQWRREALARSLGDPEPMPVRWRLTERAVMDHPRLIMASPLSFDGRSDRISALADEFRGLRRRRLVILGGPGSGKTTLGVQLLLELLATRQPDEPVPVLVSLARWDSVEQPGFHGWLADRLGEDYPSLRAFSPDVARTLAEQGKILPILDGLDELPVPRQSRVIAALNGSLTETDQLVLTSRTQDYGTAVAEAQDVLTAAAVIEPEPLSPAQAADYLAACLPPDPGPSWQEVLDQLREGVAEHLATVLATPMGLWLLRTVYISPRADPAALLNSTALRDPAILQANLFDKLIPAVLTARPPSRNSADIFRPHRTWNPYQVRNWLTYLAHHLHQAGTRDLLWWHLARHTLTTRHVRWLLRLVIGLTITLVLGLVVGLMVDLTDGLATGLVAGLLVGLLIALVSVLMFGLVVGHAVEGWLIDEPTYANLQLKQRTNLLARMVVPGLAFGLVGLPAVFAAGLGIGLAIGLATGLVIGVVRFVAWMGIPSKHDWATTPRSTYKATRTLTLLQISAVGWVIGLVFGLAMGIAIGPGYGLIFGMMFGLGGGLVIGMGMLTSGAWLSYALASCWLAAYRKLPLRLMDFLDDAHRLGLMRTTGPAYQFRHAEFHDHLLPNQ